MSISHYIKLLRNMSVKINNGQKKPNKAIMLLSVIDLIRCNYISSNKIYIEDIIQTAFNYNWIKYCSEAPPSAWIPFWHLRHEPFWHFHPIDNSTNFNNLVKPGETASLKTMKGSIKFAYLDDLLYEYFLDINKRNILIETIIRNYIGNLNYL